VNGTTTKTVTVAATVPVTGVSSTPVTVVVYYGTGR
jgi:hypothetical protein